MMNPRPKPTPAERAGKTLAQHRDLVILMIGLVTGFLMGRF